MANRKIAYTLGRGRAYTFDISSSSGYMGEKYVQEFGPGFFDTSSARGYMGENLYAEGLVFLVAEATRKHKAFLDQGPLLFRTSPSFTPIHSLAPPMACLLPYRWLALLEERGWG